MTIASANEVEQSKQQNTGESSHGSEQSNQRGDAAVKRGHEEILKGLNGDFLARCFKASLCPLARCYTRSSMGAAKVSARGEPHPQGDSPLP